MQVHDTLTMPLNTDVVEWCPAPGLQRCLAVGTYQLDEASGQREGRLQLYTLDGSNRLAPAAAVDLPGVFDLRWHPDPVGPPLLAAALADGSVRLFAVAGAGAALEEACSTGNLSGALAVSLDYARRAGEEGSTLAVSYSDGTLQQFQVRLKYGGVQVVLLQSRA